MVAIVTCYLELSTAITLYLYLRLPFNWRSIMFVLGIYAIFVNGSNELAV